MSVRNDLVKILKAFTLKNRNPSIDFENLVQFLEKYLDKHESELKDLAQTRGAALREQLQKTLLELQNEGVCSLQMLQNRIQVVRYVAFYIELVEQEYRRITSRGEIPFPTKDSLGIVVNPESLINVDIKIDFISFLEKKKESTPLLLNLTVSDIPKAIIITSRFLERPLIEAALSKIRIHLRQQKNAMYLQQKILPIFRQKERILKDQFINVVTKPDLTLQELSAPTDFIFQFWSQLTNAILKEYVPKKDKLEEETDLCLSADLIGLYAMYYKGRVQKEKESDSALKTLANNLEKSPYAFTFHEIYTMADDKGAPLVNRLGQEKLKEFLESRTRSADAVTLPEIIKVKTFDKKEYFIRRETVGKILLGRVYGLSKELKNYFIAVWTDSLLNDKKLPEMLDDKRFTLEVENRLKAQDPLFQGLLNFSLLYLLREQVPLPEVEKDFLSGLFDLHAKSLVSPDKILGLSRKDLLSDARLRLPFWKVIPILSTIITFLRKMFQPSGKKMRSPSSGRDGAVKTLGAAVQESSSSDATKRAQKAKFNEEIENLKISYIGTDGDLKKEISALAGLWNPLLDPQAKNNLIEDVNALVRDFFRKLKLISRLQAPDTARLEKLAEELSRHQALNGIRDKEHLKEYIALYMIELLGKV